MSEPKFTPRPWITDGRVVWSSSSVIAEVERWKTPTEPIVEATANGHLIAAAPDLYAVAEWFDELIGNLYSDPNAWLDVRLPERRRLARIALSKARGE